MDIEIHFLASKVPGVGNTDENIVLFSHFEFRLWLEGRIKCEIVQRPTSSRLASEHLKPPFFRQQGPYLPRVPAEQASPQHILDCLELDWEEMDDSPLLYRTSLKSKVSLSGLFSDQREKRTIIEQKLIDRNN
ncbi:hypothetical protein TNIN_98671 [Trichonephila inaurata madagascariensis]|uniref:Uncharacterized protein n=1 Tax=Trichonephila inaurata madagascariensis TaxID=2747483 RepID=A0A8X7C1M5_9ARAC|nr:hypothetical protein TNIN_98671 [Trichonephila inaurata madagascariensis]